MTAAIGKQTFYSVFCDLTCIIGGKNLIYMCVYVCMFNLTPFILVLSEAASLQ